MAQTNKHSFLAAVAFWLPALFFYAASGAMGAATPAGTIISNTATAAYLADGMLSVATLSNTVSVTTTKYQTPATIELMKYAPSVLNAETEQVYSTEYQRSSGSYANVSRPVPLGSTTPLDLSSPLPLVDAELYKKNEPLFVRVTDLDQNTDPARVETILITLKINETGDTEVLRLKETGANTGVFMGYIRLVATGTVQYNGVLSIVSSSTITASYEDNLSGVTTTITAKALVDPYGVVFDSLNGTLLNGATVTLMNTSTGSPALVYGDDGVSIYPSTVITGGTVKDSKGNVYTFSTGEYRFPSLLPGTYRLAVIPPAGYRTPSVVSTEDIQKISGSSFAIETGSRGEDFIVNPGPIIHIDIPADPAASLYVVKTASKTSVSQGDFLQYRVTVENTVSSISANNVTVSDRLPLGFRYRKGSLKVNGGAAGEPVIASDGRTISVNIGNIAAGKTSDITYIVEVTVAARPGRAVNMASAASADGAASNIARVSVQVKEELFSSKSFIAGKVVANGCNEESDDAEKGVEGIRIYLEDGAYVLTDKKGLYHFEGIKPGTHVVQLDKATIPKNYEIQFCRQNTAFASTPYSQFVDMQGGTLWRADFYLAEKPNKIIELKGEAGIELKSSLAAGQPPSSPFSKGEFNAVDFRIPVHVSKVPLKNMRLTAMLPQGLSYINGSSRLGEAELPDPLVMENALTYSMGDVESGWNGEVRFKASIGAQAGDKELVTKALLTFDTSLLKNQRTPVAENALIIKPKTEDARVSEMTLHPHFEEFIAELSKEDMVMLDKVIEELKKLSIEHVFVTGHTDSTGIRKRSKHIFADNYALSMGRAKSVADYIANALNLSSTQVTVEGKGPDKPVASNKTKEGRAMNRRVELRILAKTGGGGAEVKNIQGESGIKSVEVTEKREAGKEFEGEKKEIDKKIMPEFDNEWLEKAQPGLEWLWPSEGFNPPIPSLKVAIKHDPAKKLKLFMNGEEVDPVSFDSIIKRQDGKVAVSFWFGIGLFEGDNFFEAVEYNNDVESGRIKYTVHYSRPPVKAEVILEKSMLIADGKTPPVIAVRLTDKDGYPAREGVIGEYSVDPPYIALQKIEDLQNDPLNVSKSNSFKYQVADDGIALIKLQPTTKTGEALLKFNLSSGIQEMKTWLKPGDRDWILVGLGEGTAGYNTVKGNMENLSDSDEKENLYKDGRLAFFAKGKIKGEWLLTAAYDSDKSWRAKNNNSLYGIIDPDTYYTLYGDASQQQYEAASARPLYLKIERDRFYALFGDFDTGLTMTELSRYSRNLNGFKSEMKGEKFDFNIFISDTNQAFVKDEIRGDGTSGLYRLSRKNIVLNSESVTIETRNRFKSEVIISSQKLSRHVDYSIDYESGDIYLKTPASPTDGNFNPVYIVVEYESYDSLDSAYNYGGRGAVRGFDNAVELGVTRIHEGRTGGEGDLSGIDATVNLDSDTKLKTEYAATSTELYRTSSRGSAYLAELSHKSDTMEGKAYIREQMGNFGLGQQRGSEMGTRKLGIDGIYRFDNLTSLQSNIYRQYNLATDAVRDVVEAQVKYAEKQYDLHAGLRYAQDVMGDSTVNKSEQLLLGGQYRLLDEKLTLRLDRDQSLLGNNDNSSDFPSRTIMGADYKLGDSASLFIDEEFTQGKKEDTETTHIGLKASPWSNGQINSSVGQESRENGTRVFSSLGLKQAWQVTEKWTLDGGLDRSSTIKNDGGNTQFNANVPASSGGADFTAASLGAGYKEKKWSWTGRVEMRDAKNEDKLGVFSAVNGEPAEGVGMAAGLQAFKTESATAGTEINTNLRLSAAYRPEKTKWIVLDRLDFITDEQKGASFNFNNWRIVNNLNTNYRLNFKTQLALQYGAKYMKETIDNNEYSGYTDLFGLELRYDLTQTWDIGLRGSILHSWNTEQFKYSYGPSIGYNVAKNIWLSVGYNLAGFRDRDFSKADFTSEGPFIKFRLKFDQESARDAVKWFAGQ